MLEGRISEASRLLKSRDPAAALNAMAEEQLKVWVLSQLSLRIAVLAAVFKADATVALDAFKAAATLWLGRKRES